MKVKGDIETFVRKEFRDGIEYIETWLASDEVRAQYESGKDSFGSDYLLNQPILGKCP